MAKEKTIEEVTAELETAKIAAAESKKEIAEHVKTINGLQKDIDKKDVELKKVTESSDKKIEDLKTEITQHLEVVSDLRAQLNSKTKEADMASPTVKHAGKTYKIMIPSFQHNGAVKTAGDLKSDKELIKELVELGSGVLEEVEA